MTPETRDLLLSLLAGEMDRLRMWNTSPLGVYGKGALVKGEWRGDMHRRHLAGDICRVRRAIRELRGVPINLGGVDCE